MARVLHLNHIIPYASERPLVLMPIGLYCNKALQRAECGQILEFATDWQKEKLILSGKAKIKINTPAFGLLMRHIYGENMTISKLMRQWESWAVLSGLGKDGFSREECLIIETTR